jgi:hypothetical protein
VSSHILKVPRASAGSLGLPIDRRHHKAFASLGVLPSVNYVPRLCVLGREVSENALWDNIMAAAAPELVVVASASIPKDFDRHAQR